MGTNVSPLYFLSDFFATSLRGNFMSNGFIKLPRSLFTDPLWKELSPHCQMIFLEILSHVCYSPQKFLDHGKIIELEPGQICTTIRAIQKWCGPHFSKNDVERSIKQLILCQFLRQEVRHIKSIITISHTETYDYLVNNVETGNETRLRQDRDKIETQNKKDKKEKKEKEELHPLPPKISFRELVTLTQDQYDKLLADDGPALLESKLDFLDSYKGSNGKKYDSDFHVMKKGGWLDKKAKEGILNGTNTSKPAHNGQYHSTAHRQTKERDGTPVDTSCYNLF